MCQQLAKGVDIHLITHKIWPWMFCKCALHHLNVLEWCHGWLGILPVCPISTYKCLCVGFWPRPSVGIFFKPKFWDILYKGCRWNLGHHLRKKISEDSNMHSWTFLVVALSLVMVAQVNCGSLEEYLGRVETRVSYIFYMQLTKKAIS